MSAIRRVPCGYAEAEHAHAADRFARKIVRILAVVVMRSQRLMGRPLGRNHQRPHQMNTCSRPLLPCLVLQLRLLLQSTTMQGKRE